MNGPTRSRLQFPAGDAGGSIVASSPYGGSSTAPIGIAGSKEFEVRGTHYDGEGLVFVRVESTDPIAPHNSVSIAMTADQWAAVFAVVASVAPRPVWSMTEELKHV